MVTRLIPSIPAVDWDITTLDKTGRQAIKDRLVVGITHSEEEYQTVISYLYSKYPDLMDKNPDGMNLQWNYAPHKNKSQVCNKVTGDVFDMYAIFYYDPARQMEPVAFAGSYFKLHHPESGPGVWGHGYVLFIDPDYRRMGLASASWLQEAQLYRDSYVKYQYDIQNEDSLRVTQSMFSDPEKCKIVAPGRLKQDGTRAGIRILMDYEDVELIDSFNALNDNMRYIYGKPDWSFLEREGLEVTELTKHWNKA